MKPDKTEDCTLPTSKYMRLCNIQNTVYVDCTINTEQYVEKFNLRACACVLNWKVV
jgi:hypothetical protein